MNTIWSPTNVYHENQYSFTVVEVDNLTVTITAYHRTGASAYAPSGDIWTYTAPDPTRPAPPTGLKVVAVTAGR